MRLRNTPWAYGPMARFNHWLGAILILSTLALGLIFPELPRGTGRTLLRILHISIGTALVPLVLWRLLWRFSVPAPLPLNSRPSRQFLARTAQLALLACLVTMLASGVLMQWFGGRQIGIFNLLRIASPFAPSELWQERMALCHSVAAWTLIGLVAVHLLGLALYSVRHGPRAWARMGGRVRR
jgi:cytochrome b561